MTAAVKVEVEMDKGAVLPANPFTEGESMGNRRVLKYDAELNLPRAGGKLVPMQLFEGMDLFPPVAQLLDRCRWLEGRVAELEKEVEKRRHVRKD